MDKMLDEYYHANEQSIDNKLDNSKFKYTAMALRRFYSKSLSVSNTIQKIDYERDYYVVFILIRSQIEHFMVMLYIWIKFFQEENDSVAKKYYEDYTAQEFFKRETYASDNKIDPGSKIAEQLSELIRLLKESGLIEQQKIEELNRTKNQFGITNISRFINESLPDDLPIFFQRFRLKEMLQLYSFCSSHVHGGPTADQATYDTKNNSQNIIAQGFGKWSKNLLTVQRFYILYFLAYDDLELRKEIELEIEKLRETEVN